MKNHETIFEQLKSEHDDLKKLLKKAETASVNERKSLLKAIEEELVPHARAEERLYTPSFVNWR